MREGSQPLTAALSGDFGKERLLSVRANIPGDLPITEEKGKHDSFESTNNNNNTTILPPLTDYLYMYCLYNRTPSNFQRYLKKYPLAVNEH